MTAPAVTLFRSIQTVSKNPTDNQGAAQAALKKPIDSQG